MFRITLDGKHYYDLTNEKDVEIFSAKLKQKVWDNLVNHLNDNSLTKTLDECAKKGITYNFKLKEDQLKFLKLYLTLADQDLNVSKTK